eukprot:403981-Pelagomonas_calceolata.AAC.4
MQQTHAGAPVALYTTSVSRAPSPKLLGSKATSTVTSTPPGGAGGADTVLGTSKADLAPEREREKEREYVCVCVTLRAHAHVIIYGRSIRTFLKGKACKNGIDMLFSTLLVCHNFKGCAHQAFQGFSPDPLKKGEEISKAPHLARYLLCCCSPCRFHHCPPRLPLLLLPLPPLLQLLQRMTMRTAGRRGSPSSRPGGGGSGRCGTRGRPGAR